jgi:hypothetical protein
MWSAQISPAEVNVVLSGDNKEKIELSVLFGSKEYQHTPTPQFS